MNVSSSDKRCVERSVASGGVIVMAQLVAIGFGQWRVYLSDDESLAESKVICWMGMSVCKTPDGCMFVNFVVR
jgi:hypothetical protein